MTSLWRSMGKAVTSGALAARSVAAYHWAIENNAALLQMNASFGGPGQDGGAGDEGDARL